MTDADRKAEAGISTEQPAEMPLPNDPKVIFLGGLFVLALLATAYVAAEIILPMVFAFTLKLLLQPIMRVFERLHVPRALAALFLIVALFGTIVGLGAAISGPAAHWAAKLPEGIPRLQERLSFLRTPIDTLQHFLQQAEGIGPSAAVAGAAGSAGGPAIMATLFAGTRSFASGLFTTVLFLYFLLASGDNFLRRLVEILPRFSSKRQAVDISQQIESDISAYLITITIMNAAVGVATAIVMWLTGVGDPALWGTVAFLLNYAPILGPVSGVFVFLLIGLLRIDPLWQAMLPAGLYLTIHLVEGETATPMLLAKRFTLNPVLVILSFVFWFWMWGIPGAILSMPMLESPRSFATGFDRLPHSAIFLRDESSSLPLWNSVSAGSSLLFVSLRRSVAGGRRRRITLGGITALCIVCCGAEERSETVFTSASLKFEETHGLDLSGNSRTGRDAAERFAEGGIRLDNAWDRRS